ncbi:MAG: hypothetical protein ABIG71_01825 [Candidatus Uhrbacteria bacterium]
MGKKSGSKEDHVREFLEQLDAVSTDRARAFANVVAVANERFGVPMQVICGFDNGKAVLASRWKRAKSLPPVHERVAVIGRIRRLLSDGVIA